MRCTFGDTPDVLAAFDDTAVGGTDVLGRADDREGDGIEEHVGVLGVFLIVERGSVDTDALRINNFPDLQVDASDEAFWVMGNKIRTRCLKVYRSFWVRVSALATTGMRLTRVPRRFMISMSRGLRLHSRQQPAHARRNAAATHVWPVGRIKYRHACTRRSIFSLRSGCCSWRMYASCWSSMKSTMGDHESRLLT